MLGEFMYHNPTTLYFGSQSLENLDRELPLYGPNVLLVYGGGSIKKNGIYDAVLSYLKKNHKVVTDLAAILPKELPFPPMLMMIPGKSSMSVLKNRKRKTGSSLLPVY